MDYGDHSYISGDESFTGEDDVLEIAITGAPIEEDALEQFLDRGRSVQSTLHPFLDNSLAWISDNVVPKDKRSVSKTPCTAEETFLYQTSLLYDGEFVEQKTNLALDLSEIYEDVQISYNDNPEADIVELVAGGSRSYREKLHAVSLEVLNKSQEQGLTDIDEQWRQTLIDALTVWDCAQAIYMAPRGALLSDGLMDWVNYCDPQPLAEDGEDIMTARKPYQHPGFWDYISKGIIRGLFDVVGTCLSTSGLTQLDSATSRAINDLCLLLRTCPRASKFIGKPIDFRDRHRVWRAKASKALKECQIDDPEVSSAIRQIYELLKGDKDALYRQCDSWQECLAALALLFDPAGMKGPADVSALFEMITESDDFGLTVDRTLPSEEACAAFCAGVIPKGITKAKAVDVTVSALLADLLEKAEVLDDVRNGDLDLTLRDATVLELGDFCMSQPGIWRAAVTYWRTVGDVGIDSIQQVITHIAFSNQAEVEEILSICTDLDLQYEASQIESIWARRLVQARKPYQSIVAYERAENPRRIDDINWSLFKESLLAGHSTANDQELEDALETPETTSSNTIVALMAPFATLMTLYKLKETNDATNAALHLSALLKSSDTPKECISILMAEMLPFLQPAVNAFTLRDIFDMLAAIEEFYDSKQFSESLVLLTKAMASPASPTAIPDWKTFVTAKFEAQDVLSLVRLRIAQAIGLKFCKE